MLGYYLSRGTNHLVSSKAYSWQDQLECRVKVDDDGRPLWSFHRRVISQHRLERFRVAMGKKRVGSENRTPKKIVSRK